MLRGRALFALVSLSILCCGLLACGGPSEEELQAAKAAEDWAKMQTTKADLDAKQAELVGLRERIAAGPEEAEEGEGDGGEGEEAEGEAPPSPEELAAQADALQEEILGTAEQFGGQVIAFINDQGIVEGAELTDMQLGALRMKSDVDMLFAADYIARGGEYGKAIDIYSTALRNDPDNEKLLEAKATAEMMRFMTEERLATVKKGMTQDEVRGLLGTPKTTNVREFEQGVVGWFFPKEEPNTAAAVFFQPKKDVLEVYKVDFNAVGAKEE